MNWDTINALVATGMGVGFVPEILVSPASSEQTTYCRILAENTTRSYVVTYKKGRSLSTAAQHFIRIAKQSLQLAE